LTNQICPLYGGGFFYVTREAAGYANVHIHKRLRQWFYFHVSHFAFFYHRWWWLVVLVFWELHHIDSVHCRYIERPWKLGMVLYSFICQYPAITIITIDWWKMIKCPHESFELWNKSPDYIFMKSNIHNLYIDLIVDYNLYSTWIFHLLQTHRQTQKIAIQQTKLTTNNQPNLYH